MTTLLASLPPARPSLQTENESTKQIQAYNAPLAPKVFKEAPPYGQRQSYVPRRNEDFGDGGAFPEIRIDQYPLDMGRKGPGGYGGIGQTLAVTVGSDGQVNYDAIVTQGNNRKKIVHSTQKALVPKPEALDKLTEYHDEDEVKETALNTWEALQKIVEKKTAATQPKSLPAQPGQASYVKYTPSQQGAQYNSGAKQRVVRLQDMPIDPLEPPKFRHKKVPRGPTSPPVPVMHSPPRPITKQEMSDWKIPPSISNWKNPKGYTIPLDKRLAADGRGLQEQAVNSKHASFAEALYYAEDKTRQEIQLAAQIKQERKLKLKEQKEQELRNIAMQARLERGGGQGQAQNRLNNSEYYGIQGNGVQQQDMIDTQQNQQQYNSPDEADEPQRNYKETAEEAEERRKRDQIRQERKRERDREARLQSKNQQGYKRSKVTRDKERDISEKVALGQAYTGPTNQNMYDTRLFNQDKGLESGFANEDQYNIYDKPWQPERNQNLYRPRQQEGQRDTELYSNTNQQSDIQTDKFKPDKGFQGVDYSGKQGAQHLEFEGAQEPDPFGLDQLFTNVNQGKKN